MRETWKLVFETLKMAALALLIVVPIRYFLFQPFVVSGSSMYPNFHDGDYLIIDEITYRFRKPERGEVIIFQAPPHPSTRYIKRIVGLPGEEVEIKEGEIIIKRGGESFSLREDEYISEDWQGGKMEVELGRDEYFVLGDNRGFSSDSRSWGPLPRENIIGRAYLRAFPFTRFSKIEAPTYSLQGAFSKLLVLNYG